MILFTVYIYFCDGVYCKKRKDNNDILYVCYFVIKLLQLFKHIYVILYYLL